MSNILSKLPFSAVCALGALAACVSPGPAQTRDQEILQELPPQMAPTYADLVDLAEESELVAVVLINDQISVPIERAPGLRPGEGRFFVESSTQRLLSAPGAMGESLDFLIDLARDSDGDLPDMEDRTFLLFGNVVAGQPGFAQLLSSDSLFPSGPVIEGRVAQVLTQLASADSMAAITGVKDVISVPGNLAGESETQLFIETASGAPVSISVIRRPGMEPAWGISAGEIVDQAARPPAPETISWYRLACELPEALPADSYLQNDRRSRQMADEDYAFIRAELGPCTRRM